MRPVTHADLSHHITAIESGLNPLGIPYVTDVVVRDFVLYHENIYGWTFLADLKTYKNAKWFHVIVKTRDAQGYFDCCQSMEGKFGFFPFGFQIINGELYCMEGKVG
jgi:hypothetical protein